MRQQTATGGRSVFSNERPAFSVVPPAIARHVLFRLHSDEKQGAITESQHLQRVTAVREALSKHLNEIREAFGETGEKIEIVTDASIADGRTRFLSNRSIYFEVKQARRFGYRLHLRADMYYELFTVSYQLDHIGHDDNTSDVTVQMSRLPRNADAVDWLFDQIWESADFPATHLITRWTKQFDDTECSRSVGEVVADFRTVLLYRRERWLLDQPSLEFSRIAVSEESQIVPEILSFASEHQALIRRVAGSNHIGGEPLLCGMAGGQALYVTELGQWGIEAHSINPIRLMLVYAGHSHAQLGRLMRRLHVLGELRHAAVLDWDRSSFGEDRDLRVASLKLQELSNRVNNATLAIEAVEIDALLHDFAQIGMWVEGGLNYRIERSRSYAASFLDTLPHLRIIRVAGWQPYDDFINRYIGLLFGRIDRIGFQYDELGRRIDRLLERDHAQQIAHYQRSVKTTLDHVDTLINEMRSDGDRQLDLLGNAELFAIIFCVYYVGSIVRHAIFDKDHTDFNILGINASFDLLWAVVAGLLCAVLGARLWFTRRRRIKSRREADARADLRLPLDL